MFFILEGCGEVRIGRETFAIRKGDVIAHPPGDAGTAHQIVNTSNADLEVSRLSTMERPEICDYPDFGKFAVTNVEPGADGKPAFWRHAAREKDGVDYRDGE